MKSAAAQFHAFAGEGLVLVEHRGSPETRYGDIWTPPCGNVKGRCAKNAGVSTLPFRNYRLN
jgi:hypothetical protein